MLGEANGRSESGSLTWRLALDLRDRATEPSGAEFVSLMNLSIADDVYVEGSLTSGWSVKVPACPV